MDWETGSQTTEFGQADTQWVEQQQQHWGVRNAFEFAVAEEGATEEEVWENERWGIDRQGRSRFGPEFLYPVERSHFEPTSQRVLGVIFEACFASRKSAAARSVNDPFWDDAALPTFEEWLGPWEVDESRCESGWLYGVNFVRDAHRSLSAHCQPHHFVRTRRWTRRRRKVARDNDDYGALPPEEHLSPCVDGRSFEKPARLMWSDAARAKTERANAELIVALAVTLTAILSTALCGAPRVAMAAVCVNVSCWTKWLAFGLARRLTARLGCDVSVGSVRVSLGQKVTMRVERVRIGDPKSSSPIVTFGQVEASMRWAALFWGYALSGGVLCQLETMRCAGVEIYVEALDDDRVNCDLLAADDELEAAAIGMVEKAASSSTLKGLEALGLIESVRRAGVFLAQCEAASTRLSKLELFPRHPYVTWKTVYVAKEARAENWKISVGASAWAAVLRGSLVVDLLDASQDAPRPGSAWRRSVVERLLNKIDDFDFELEVDRVAHVSSQNYESASSLCVVLGQQLRELAAKRVVEKLAAEAKLELERLFSDDNHVVVGVKRKSWLEQLLIEPLSSNSRAIARIRENPSRTSTGDETVVVDQDLVDRVLEETPLGAAVEAFGVTAGAKRALAAGLEGALKFAFEEQQVVKKRRSSESVEQYASLASTAVDALMPVVRAVRDTLEAEWKHRAPQALVSLDAAVAELDVIREEAALAAAAARQISEKTTADDDAVSLVSNVLRSTDTNRLLAVCARIADVVSCVDKVATQDTVEKVAQTLATHADAHVVAALTEKALDLFLEAFHALPAGAFKGQTRTPLLGTVAYGLEQVNLSDVQVRPQQIEIALLEFEGGTTVRELAFFTKGQKCTTPYGPGTVTRYDALNRMYRVQLSFGTATLRPECVAKREDRPWYPTARYLDPKPPQIVHTRRLVQSLDLATAKSKPPKPRDVTPNSDHRHYPAKSSLSSPVAPSQRTSSALVDGLVSIRLRDLDAPLSGLRWSYSQEQWPYASDSGVADAELAGIRAIVTLAARRSRINGNVYLCISQIEVHLERVSLAVRESKIAGFYNALASTLATPLKDYVATSLQTALKTEAHLRLKPTNDYLEHNNLWPLLLALSKIKISEIPYDDDLHDDIISAPRHQPLFSNGQRKPLTPTPPTRSLHSQPVRSAYAAARDQLFSRSDLLAGDLRKRERTGASGGTR